MSPAFDRLRAEQPAADLTITAAHRTLLRRILNDQPAGDLSHLLADVCAGYLVSYGRIAGRYVLTEDGRRLLQAHDALAVTVRRERPRLTSKPMPPRWQRVTDTSRPNVRLYVHTVVRCSVELFADQVSPIWLAAPDSYSHSASAALDAARDLVALIEFDNWQQAVAAQDAKS